jgi:hypothetical protein
LLTALVDADAYIPGQGYIGAEGVDAPDVTAAFAHTAEQLRQQFIPVSGDFASGWIDSSECCRIIAKAVGLPKPSGWFDNEQVQQIFAKASWPNFDELRRGTKPWDCSEYSNHVVAKAFVDLCVKHNLEIHFT